MLRCPGASLPPACARRSPFPAPRWQPEVGWFFARPFDRVLVRPASARSRVVPPAVRSPLGSPLHSARASQSVLGNPLASNLRRTHPFQPASPVAKAGPKRLHLQKDSARAKARRAENLPTKGGAHGRSFAVGRSGFGLERV